MHGGRRSDRWSVHAGGRVSMVAIAMHPRDRRRRADGMIVGVSHRGMGGGLVAIGIAPITRG